jgi:hypothetical protein
MNLQEIQDSIQKLLSTEAGLAKVAGRRKIIAKLAVSLNKATVETKPRLRSRKAWFSTTQGDAENAKGKIRVQLLGLDIGYLSFDTTTPPKPRYLFHPKPPIVREVFRDCPVADLRPWCWSHSKKDAARINQFLERCESKHPRAKADNEKEIQWQLADALLSDTVGPLKHLRPLTWNKLFTEIGVSVAETGEPGTGNIDLLVRRLGGAQGAGFLVFELKKPGEKGVEAALQQALRYAMALHIEANDCKESKERDLENRGNYRTVFGSRGNAKLKMGAVVVLENTETVKSKALEILAQYGGQLKGSRVDRIGMLLYGFDKKERKVTSWEWLPGWDARELPSSSSQTAGWR